MKSSRQDIAHRNIPRQRKIKCEKSKNERMKKHARTIWATLMQ